MNPLNELWEFGKAHYGVIVMGFAWSVREWTTVRGWTGLKSWIKTGKLEAPEPDSLKAALQPQPENIIPLPKP